MKRALVTGITGQDGLYLSELLLAKGYEVYGLIRGQNNPKVDLVRRTVPDVKLLTGDITDLSSLMRAFGDAHPDEVYNLGAISFVAYSWENAKLTSDVTGLGVLNMLEATRLYAGDDLSKVRFYQASSSEMFGKVQDVPQRESTLLWPRSPVRRGEGLRPLHDHQLPRVLRDARLLRDPVQPRVAAARAGVRDPQGHPGRRPDLPGLQESISLGNLDAKRDWGFAGDYVDAMWRMIQQDEGDDYVVATGETHSIRELLDVAFTRVGIDEWEAKVIQDPRFFRPAEVDLLIGDPAKAKEKLGWEPQVGFEQLVQMMVDSDLAEQKQLSGK